MSPQIFMPAFLTALLLTLSYGQGAAYAAVPAAAPKGMAVTATLRSSSAPAVSVIEGRIAGVSDGDTLTVLDTGRREHKVRLLGVDAPE